MMKDELIHKRAVELAQAPSTTNPVPKVMNGRRNFQALIFFSSSVIR